MGWRPICSLFLPLVTYTIFLTKLQLFSLSFLFPLFSSFHSLSSQPTFKEENNHSFSSILFLPFTSFSTYICRRKSFLSFFSIFFLLVTISSTYIYIHISFSLSTSYLFHLLFSFSFLFIPFPRYIKFLSKYFLWFISSSTYIFTYFYPLTLHISCLSFSCLIPPRVT